MKLYIIDKVTKQKKHLRVVAPGRTELSKIFGATTFVVDGNHYSVNEVSAEPSSDSAAVGGLLGGFVGAVGGAPGVIIGGLLGAAIGQKQTEKEQKEAELFNAGVVNETLFHF